MSAPATPHNQLTDLFGPSHFDPLNPKDLLLDEVQQREVTGYDVDEIVQRARLIDPDDRPAILELVDCLTETARRADWPYDEPAGLDAIRATLGPLPEPVVVQPTAIEDKIRAAWLGRIAGCNLGKPFELGEQATVGWIRAYLERADAYPLRDYVPALDPTPDGFQLQACWPDTTRGRIHGSARDDDIDYTILALHLLEQHGPRLQPEQVGQAWLTLLPLRQVYTAERAAYLNLAAGFTVPDVARRHNPYREWIGAQIRADLFGYVHPGDPWGAASLAYQDASLSHVGNGIYGAMWVAALVAAAFASSSPSEALVTSLRVVPPSSRLAKTLSHVVDLWRTGCSWEHALLDITERFAHYPWVHTINNAALVAAALLWSEDYATAVGQAVMGGWDTDCNGATVGSVAAILAGPGGGLPMRFVAPLEDRTRSALFGFDNSAISDLAERTIRVQRQLS